MGSPVDVGRCRSTDIRWNGNRCPFLGSRDAVDVVLNSAHVDSPLDPDVALVSPSGAPRVTDYERR